MRSDGARLCVLQLLVRRPRARRTRTRTLSISAVSACAPNAHTHCACAVAPALLPLAVSRRSQTRSWWRCTRSSRPLGWKFLPSRATSLGSRNLARTRRWQRLPWPMACASRSSPKRTSTPSAWRPRAAASRTLRRAVPPTRGCLMCCARPCPRNRTSPSPGTSRKRWTDDNDNTSRSVMISIRGVRRSMVEPSWPAVARAHRPCRSTPPARGGRPALRKRERPARRPLLIAGAWRCPRGVAHHANAFTWSYSTCRLPAPPPARPCAAAAPLAGPPSSHSASSECRSRR